MSGVEAMIQAAVATIGFSDHNNTQRTPVHTFYNEKFGNPDPSKYAWDWCDGGVTYWAWKSGNEASVVFGGAYAYTVAHAEAFESRGLWHTDVAGIRRGDIVFFDWNGSNRISAIDHVGIVESVEGTMVHTIEANIGNVCARKVRYADTIAGYGRPKYVGAPDPGTPPPPVTPPPATLPTVRLDVVRRASNSPSWKYGANNTPASSVPDTTLVQNALIKLGFCAFPGRGDFGPLTVAGYARWQRSLGYTGSDADGHPGITSLTELGAKSGLFKV